MGSDRKAEDTRQRGAGPDLKGPRNTIESYIASQYRDGKSPSGRTLRSSTPSAA